MLAGSELEGRGLISLVTITHTAAYSIVAAAKAAGWSVVAPQGMHYFEKVRILEAEGEGADLVWAHWQWIHKCPEWLLNRSVVTVLRDPLECAISAHIRGNADKAPQHARQWLQLHRNRHRVDHWIDYRSLDLSRIGLPRLPRQNQTGNHPLKERYASKGRTVVTREIQRHWDCLRVVQPEIREVFESAGLLPALGRSGLAGVV